MEVAWVCSEQCVEVEVSRLEIPTVYVYLGSAHKPFLQALQGWGM